MARRAAKNKLTTGHSRSRSLVVTRSGVHMKDFVQISHAAAIPICHFAVVSAIKFGRALQCKCVPIIFLFEI